MSGIDDLPPLREVIQKHDLSARKELGQNFLLDLNLTSRIARASGPLEGVTVIEVGPGPGGLTRGLLAEGAKKVIAIERDVRALPALWEISGAYPGKLDIRHEDALETNYAALADGPTRIIANLPYNIATPLLIGWLTAEPWPPFFQSLTLMFQKEVADRICTGPGSKTFGRLSVLAGWRTNAQKAFDVSRSAFTPPPKVTSSIVSFVPKTDIEPVSVAALEDITRAAFGQRRKMVRQSLKATCVPVDGLLAAAGLAGTERAEDLPVRAFLAMAHELERQRAATR